MEEVGNFCKWDDCEGGHSTLREELLMQRQGRKGSVVMRT